MTCTEKLLEQVNKFEIKLLTHIQDFIDAHEVDHEIVANVLLKLAVLLVKGDGDEFFNENEEQDELAQD